MTWTQQGITKITKWWDQTRLGIWSFNTEGSKELWLEATSWIAHFSNDSVYYWYWLTLSTVSESKKNYRLLQKDCMYRFLCPIWVTHLYKKIRANVLVAANLSFKGQTIIVNVRWCDAKCYSERWVVHDCLHPEHGALGSLLLCHSYGAKTYPCARRFWVI